MTNRVALGALGSSLWGLRVSKPGQQVVSGGTAVSFEHLLFDSAFPVAQWPVRSIHHITVPAGVENANSNDVPGSRTITHSSPAMPFVPFVLGFRQVGSEWRSDYWRYTAYSGGANYLDIDGYCWRVTTSQIIVDNYYTTQQVIRMVVFDVGA